MVLIWAPEVLTEEGVLVFMALIAEALTATKVSRVKENGEEIRVAIGMMQYILDITVDMLPSHEVVSVRHAEVESWISIK